MTDIVEREEPVAWMARYIDKDGNEAVYTTTVYELAVENDVNGHSIIYVIIF